MIHDPDHAIAAARNLEAMIGQARDERFRLLHMVKDYQAKLDALPEPLSAEHTKRLSEKVGRLDAALDERMETLRQLDEHIDRRLDQLAELEASLTRLTGRLGKQVDEARGFRIEVEAAKRQVRAAVAAARAEFAEPAPASQTGPRLRAMLAGQAIGRSA